MTNRPNDDRSAGDGRATSNDTYPSLKSADRPAASRPRRRPMTAARQSPAVQPSPPGIAALTLDDVRMAYEPLQHRYGPIIFLEQASEISGLARGTLLKKLSEGSYAASVARGKPVRFWRDRFVLELMTKADKPTVRGRRKMGKPNAPADLAIDQRDAAGTAGNEGGRS